MAKVALHGHEHSCPEHSGGKVIVEASGRPTINGVSVAIVGDKCQCGSGIDTIRMGSSAFTINGIPVAITGSQTSHGGTVIEGHDSLTIDG